jgi:hypothetical protein
VTSFDNPVEPVTEPSEKISSVVEPSLPSEPEFDMDFQDSEAGSKLLSNKKPSSINKVEIFSRAESIVVKRSVKSTSKLSEQSSHRSISKGEHHYP